MKKEFVNISIFAFLIAICLCIGTDFVSANTEQEAETIELNQELIGEYVMGSVYDSVYDSESHKHWYSFMPDEDGQYEVEVSGNYVSNVGAVICDVNSTCSYDATHTKNFTVSKDEMKAGKEYHILVWCYNMQDHETKTLKIKVVKHSHAIIRDWWGKATFEEQGLIREHCSKCSYSNYNLLPYINYPRIKGSATKNYNGKPYYPSIVVDDADGKVLSSDYYDVTYPSDAAKIGVHYATVTMKGDYYEGQSRVKYYVVPGKTAISSLKKARKAFTVKWKKNTVQTTGYTIRYSTNSQMKNCKWILIKNNKTTSKKIKKLKAKKTYYVQVSTYKTVNGYRYYSGWSPVKKVKTK